MAPLRTFALSLIVLTAVMASAAGAATAQPQTAQALATLITAKGLGCKDFTADTGAGNSGISEGSCTVGHEFDVVLTVFTSHASLVKLLPNGKKNICAEMRQAHASTPTVFVIGPNWIATFESTVNAHPLAKALKAKTQTLKC
jgi:hypothetical protein